MTITLATRAKERSTYVITVSFTDDADLPVAPTTLTWTLTDLSGNVINSRSAISATPTASTMKIVLSGNDLALVSTAPNNTRAVLFEGVYNSSAGSNLPLRDQVQFQIEDLAGTT